MERNLAYVALFAAFVAALGFLPPITLASGVPITAQSLGIMLCGTILGARLGGLAALLFVALVALGLPILSGGRGGFGLFLSPSAGFLIGFPIAAFVTGWISERLAEYSILTSSICAALFGSIVVLYACGIVGMAITLDKSLPDAAVLAFPFIPGDAFKVILAGLITQAIWIARPEAVLSRA